MKKRIPRDMARRNKCFCLDDWDKVEKVFDKSIFPFREYGDTRDSREWTRAVVKSFIRCLLNGEIYGGKDMPYSRALKNKVHGQKKVGVVMSEFKSGKLRSGSKHGPMVTNPAQAIAIAMSEAGLSKRKRKK